MSSKMLAMLGLLSMGVAYAKAPEEKKAATPAAKEDKAAKPQEKKDTAAAPAEATDGGTPAKATGKKTAAPKK